MVEKIIYDFEEIDFSLRNLVGGKGAGLGEMTRRGLPVPPGFTIITTAEKIVQNQGYEAIRGQVEGAISRLEEKTQKEFGKGKDPLLVSVRSGAVISMPGVMETILNVGASYSFTKRMDGFYTDLYFRLLKNFATNVFDLEGKLIGEEDFFTLYGKDHKTLIQGIKEQGYDFPQDPREQLKLAVEAVLRSWHSQKAKDYREVEKIPEEIGTAVNVQSMVYGNRDRRSFTTVFFTRNPSDGTPGITGSVKKRTQGDALVNGEAGSPLAVLKGKDLETLESLAGKLEREFGDMQEVEATCESGTTYVLQTRAGKRTSGAGLRIILDMYDEGRLTREEALKRVSPKLLDGLDIKQIDPSQTYSPMGIGTPICPGIVNGYVALDHDGANAIAHDEGKTPILLKNILDPSDIKTIDLVGGIGTKEGDANVVSHAVVIARGKNKPCVTGIKNINFKNGKVYFGDTELPPGEPITLDAHSGEIIRGHLRLIENRENSLIERLGTLTKKDERRTYIPLVRGLEELIFQDPSSDIFYLIQDPSEILDQDELKAAVMGDQKRLARLKKFWAEEVNEALSELESNKGKIFFGTMEPDMLRRYLPNRRILEGRASLLEREVTAEIKPTPGLITQGDEIKDKSGNIYVVTGLCGGCGLVKLKGIGHWEGQSHYTLLDGKPILGYSKENSGGNKKFFNEKFEEVQRRLKEADKTNPSRITKLQKTIIIDSAKRHGKEIIVAPYSSKNPLFLFDGKIYSVLRGEEIPLTRIKDVLRNIQQ